MMRMMVGGLVCALTLGSCKLKSTDSEQLSETRVGQGIERHMSEEAKQFRDEFVRMRVEDDVAALLNKLANNYDNYKNTDIKLIAAQLIPLQHFRGVLYRLRPIVEMRSKALHSMIVTSFMQIATGSQVFATASNNGGHQAWIAINRYFNKPYPDMFKEEKALQLGIIGRSGAQPQKEGFMSVTEFQNWLISTVLPELDTAIGRVGRLNIPGDRPVIWDNQIIFGTSAFNFGPANSFAGAEEEDRFVAITEAERLAILAGMHAVKHNILAFSAYNLDLIPELTTEVGYLMGIDALKGWDVKGLSAADRKQVLCGQVNGPQCSGKFASLFTLRDQGDRLTKAAYVELVNGTKALRQAWDTLRSQGKSEFSNMRLIDPTLLPYQRITEQNMRNLERLVAGEPVRNVINGRFVAINTPKLYNNPPRDLKVFVPVSFDVTTRYHQDYRGFKNVRNYEFGRSLTWNPQVYKEYFSNVNSGSEVPEIMRDLAQTWGGWVANAPLVSVSMIF